MNRAFAFILESVTNPRPKMREILDWKLSFSQVAQLHLVLVIAVVILMQVLIQVLPKEPAFANFQFLLTPIEMLVGQIVMTGCIWVIFHRLAMFFKGTGSLEDTGMAYAWYKLIMLFVMLAMIASAVLIPFLAILCVFAGGFITVYLGVNYARVVHGFTSGGSIFLGLVLGYIGALILSTILLGVIGFEPAEPITNV